MQVSIDLLRSEIQNQFGRNKTEELCRLLYEIARRESLDPVHIYREELKRFPENRPFFQIKKSLLKRRFPNLSEKDLSRVYLAPLNLPGSLRQSDSSLQFKPTQIYIEKKALSYPLADRVLKTWPHVPIFEIDTINELRRPKKEWLSEFGKRTLAVSVEPFDLVKPCPCSSSTVSCNYYLLNIGYGCPYDCSYCYLQEYQNLPAIVLPANVGEFLQGMDLVLQKNANQFTRIGTGEYTDSLALDWLTEYSKALVPFFRNRAVTLELKTKSDCIENLLGLDHGGKTVVSWSVNPERFAKDEKGAAPVLKRLEAARQCEKAGYGTAFHFDPILHAENWENDYKEFVAKLFSYVKPSVRWISLGTLRFHKDLRRAAEFRHPDTDIFLAEERLDPVDDKMRYSVTLRIEIYQKMVSWIKEYAKNVPIYLCMESPEVWKSVFEGKPYTGRIDNWITCS